MKKLPFALGLPLLYILLAVVLTALNFAFKTHVPDFGDAFMPALIPLILLSLPGYIITMIFTNGTNNQILASFLIILISTPFYVFIGFALDSFTKRRKVNFPPPPNL